MSVDIVETDVQIERLIQQELDKHLIDVLNQVSISLKPRIRELVLNAVRAEPEYTALLKGRLRYEFGLTEPQAKLDGILAILANQIEIQVAKRKMTIYAINTNLEELLSSDNAKQAISDGGQIEWLDWLLTQGDKVIIRDYRMMCGPSEKSRTGQAIMVESAGYKWGVPPQYAGRKSNNWLTQAMDNIDDNQLEQMIVQEVSRKW